jgi:uncharacterized membrane protein
MTSAISMDDWIALGTFMVLWLGYSRFSEHGSHTASNLVNATNQYRLQWMREMVGRENRSVDAIMIGNLARSFTFFASTTIFILAAQMSFLGYRERLNLIIQEIPFARLNEPGLWQLKIFLLIFIFIFAFFKFTWSMRQYNYVSIFIGAAPDYRVRKDEHEAIAQKGAQLLANAAKHFNNGLRAYYFGLATLAWFVHPYAFILATILVVCVIYRREFRSNTLKNLII